MKYCNYKTNEIFEVKENKTLSFLYNNFIGRIILKIATTKIVANIYRIYQNSRLSKHKIKKFIKDNNINMDDYVDEEYKSFNDFFVRTIKPEKRKLEHGFISPCDSKVSVYKISNDLVLNIKNSKYTINELIGESDDKFKNGTCIVFRLCVDDYHHYIYPFNGKVISNKYINGKLHTVQPIALKKCKVFSENSREVTIVNSKEYGNVAIIEVGALMVGKIVNENILNFSKGDEKGHFEFGGSTIIYLFEKDNVNLNDVLFTNTSNDIETVVKLGMNLE